MDGNSVALSVSPTYFRSSHDAQAHLSGSAPQKAASSAVPAASVTSTGCVHSQHRQPKASRLPEAPARPRHARNRASPRKRPAHPPRYPPRPTTPPPPVTPADRVQNHARRPTKPSPSHPPRPGRTASGRQFPKRPTLCQHCPYQAKPGIRWSARLLAGSLDLSHQIDKLQHHGLACDPPVACT